MRVEVLNKIPLKKINFISKSAELTERVVEFDSPNVFLAEIGLNCYI